MATDAGRRARLYVATTPDVDGEYEWRIGMTADIYENRGWAFTASEAVAEGMARMVREGDVTERETIVVEHVNFA